MVSCHLAIGFSNLSSRHAGKAIGKFSADAERRRPIQYLGKISFSLYLVHQSVYHLVRDPVINILWYIATREQYPGAEDASKLGGSFAFTWLAGYVVMSATNLYTAHLYTKYVDERCVRMAKRIDKWLTRPWPICIYTN
ncbi:acyltransferase 3 [Penicillium desertorum]|uniref:Acyltransferase 3 n=1 Tax=Penicillium desertorum TaxID=1303715 RepID=A0A9W9WIV7_9EURO|nr:acyltransferase 3 [Penicillium desertorum]